MKRTTAILAALVAVAFGAAAQNEPQPQPQPQSPPQEQLREQMQQRQLEQQQRELQRTQQLESTRATTDARRLDLGQRLRESQTRCAAMPTAGRQQCLQQAQRDYDAEVRRLDDPIRRPPDGRR